jgi:hypothetical protein
MQGTGRLDRLKDGDCLAGTNTDGV